MPRLRINLHQPRTVVLLLVVILGVLAGCSTPRQRYQVLKVFFDGVPNPDAPKVVARVDEPNDAHTTVAVVVRSQHKPYVEKKCDVCHRSASGEVRDFSLAYDACVKCHKQVSTARPLMHGPVAREACKFCHEPHEAAQPALLKDAPIKLCAQCHDQQLLGNNPPEHVDGKTNCLTCHFGHGGDARNFLKPAGMQAPVVSDTQPAAAPATPGKERSP